MINGVEQKVNISHINPQTRAIKADTNIFCTQRGNVFDEFISQISTKGQKITPKEAAKLMLNGAISQVNGLIQETIKNPLKVILPTIGTTAAIMALPLIGIPSAVGAGAVAITTAGISATRLGINLYQLGKNTQQEEYNKARENYKKIGNSTLDLALSLPFMPKAIKSVKDFAKYGKLHLNLSAIKRMKNPADILPTLKKANQEIYRGYDYTKIVDSKLSTFAMTEAERAQIRKELLSFNVPEEEIAGVVTKRLAKHKGYTHYPKPKYEQLRKNVEGSYTANTGELKLADNTKGPLPSERTRESINLKKVSQNDATTYRCKMQNSVTGEITYEIVPKDIIDDFSRLSRQNDGLSRQGRTISTVVHEFEHFDQHAKIARLKGVNIKYNPKAKKLYRHAIRTKGQISPLSPMAQEVERYASVNMAENKNFVKYLQNAKELGARTAQAQAINTPEFQRLEGIFKELPDLKDVSIAESIVPCAIQTTALNA